jgi:large subunit ribosomal protein L23
MENLHLVIKRPIVSEKSTALAEVGNRFTFEVNVKATKIDIKLAVQKYFNVKVKDVRTSIVPGKFKRRGTSTVKQSNWKKAIVTLQEGHKIDFFNTK